MRPRIHRFIERTWQRAVLGLLGVSLLIVLITLLVQPTQRDDDRVRSTLSDYVDAVGNRDGEGACKLLTARAQQLVTAAIPGSDCSAYVHSFGADVGGLVNATVRIARDLGDRVVLDPTNMTAPDGAAVNRTVELVRADGDYLIDSIGYSVGGPVGTAGTPKP